MAGGVQGLDEGYLEGVEVVVPDEALHVLVERLDHVHQSIVGERQAEPLAEHRSDQRVAERAPELLGQRPGREAGAVEGVGLGQQASQVGDG